ncbi:MAG: NAD-dependent epimerase/dehydratase family protein [Marinicellaceae bacterium]
MKVLIIGGAGFIGLSVAKKFLQKNLNVVIVDSDYRIQRNIADLTGTESIVMDFTDLDVNLLDSIISKGDIVIHLACTTNPSKSMQDIKYDAQSNILPSIDIFKIAIKNKASKIIFSSSGGTVYGNVSSSSIIESDDKKPISAYGVSKLAIENYLLLMTANSDTNGICLRIGNPYGSYQLKGTTIGAIAAFFNATKNNETITIWGDGNFIRDYLYIDDLSNAFYCALRDDSLSGVFNVGSGVGHSLNQLITIINETTQIDNIIEYTKKRGFDVPSIVLNTNKFNKKTGWSCQYSINQGINKMWDRIKNDEKN